MIMVYHFDTHFFVWAHLGLEGAFGWYIAVEFFFIVSGYLLYRTVNKGKYGYAYMYTRDRVRKIYPVYLLAFFVTFAVKVYYTQWMHSPIKVFEQLADNFLEAVMLQGIGLNRGGDYVNYTAWYVSVYLIGGYFIFYLLKRNRKLFLELIAPILIVVFYSHLYRFNGNLDATIAITEGFFGNVALFRGIADMCVGVYAAIIGDYIVRRFENEPSSKILCIIKTTGVLCILLVMAASLKYGLKTYDFMYVVLLAYGVMTAFISWSEKNGNKTYTLVKHFSGLTLNMYLIHNALREWVFPGVFSNTAYYPVSTKYAILLLYIIVTVIFAEIMNLMVIGIKRVFSNRN